VLIDNGFTPTWITYQKDIRDHSVRIREKLKKERAKIGPLPLNLKDEQFWEELLNHLQPDVKSLNTRIDTYNLVVPILNKQMFHFNLEEEAEKVLKEGEYKSQVKELPSPKREAESTESQKRGIMKVVFAILK